MAIDPATLNPTKLNALGEVFSKEFADTEKTRQQTKEEEMLQAIRACKGIHDPEISFTENESRIYSQYTRSKEVPLRAKLNQHLIPEKEKNWEIAATPRPRVSPDTLQQIAQSLVKQDEATGQTVDPSPAEVTQAVREYSGERANNMSITINDQLIEANDKVATKKQIHSGIRYGTGVKKGPITNTYKEVEPVQENGIWVQKDVEKFKPGSEFIPLWRFFPDMSTTEVEQCMFAYELHSKTKHEMRELAARSDFFGDVIEQILIEKPSGNYSVRNWEQLLQTVDPNATTTIKVNDGTTVTAGASTGLSSNNYEVLERNGFIDGQDLLEAGLIKEDSDVRAEYFGSLWICNKKVIRYFPWPADVVSNVAELYHLFYYEKDETSVLGTGLPRIIRDRQLTLNAGERHMINHAAWLEGPCGEVDHSRVLPAWRKFLNKLSPGVFFATNGSSSTNGKVFNIYDIADHMSSYIQFMQFQKAQGDEESSLPTYLFSSPTPGSNETAKGVTTRFTNLLDFIKDLAGNFDTANVSMIKGFYRWNMRYNPDPMIRGDMEIKAIGSAQALIKDAIRESIGFIMQSLPEPMQAWIKWRQFTKELLKSMFDDPENMMLTEEEFAIEQQRIQQQQQQMAEFQKWLATVKGQYDMAKASAMDAKAQKTLAEIPAHVDEKRIGVEQKKADLTATNLENVRKHVDIEHAISGEGEYAKEPSGAGAGQTA